MSFCFGGYGSNQHNELAVANVEGDLAYGHMAAKAFRNSAQLNVSHFAPNQEE
jgi:hypothetical protein